MAFSKRTPPVRSFPADPEARLVQNRRLLNAYAARGETCRSVSARNALVAANLPLVRSVAARRCAAIDLPFEDLVQVGSLGLIRAVEAFDPRRSSSLSSFAVPYILGAIRHEVRDRLAMVRIPRQLWDLRQQVAHLQERRRRQGQVPLAEPDLVATLGCAAGPLQDALGLSRVVGVRSLDAPLGQGRGEGESGTTLLEQLADPASLSPEAGMGSESDSDGSRQARAELRWLRQALARLDPIERRLLVGRLEEGCTWVELGAELAMPARQAQRRCNAVQHRLMLAAEAWRAAREGP